MARGICIIAAITLSGCLHITTATRVVETPIKKTAPQVLEVEKRIGAVARVDAANVTLQLEETKLCRPQSKVTYERKELHERTLIHEGCRFAFRGSDPMKSDENSCIYAYLGFPFFFVDYFRAIDTSSSLDDQTRAEFVAELSPCGKRSLSGERIIVTIGPKRWESTTDRSGSLAIPLAETLTTLFEARGTARAGVLALSTNRVTTNISLSQLLPLQEKYNQFAAQENVRRSEAAKQEEERKKEQEKREAEKKAQRYKDATLQEVRSGRCLAARHGELQRVLQGFKQMFKSQDLDLAWHEIGVAKPGGTGTVLQANLSGEYHLFVIGYDTLKLAVADKQGNAITLPSEFQGIIRTNRWDADSRIMQANVLDKYAVKVTGQGCMMLMAYHKY